MKVKNLFTLAVVFLIALVGSGCSTLSQSAKSVEEVKVKLSSSSSGHIGLKTGEQKKRVPKLTVPQLSMGATSADSVLNRRFTLVVKRVPVKSILYSLAKDAHIQLDLHPIKNTRITMMLKNVPLRLILDRISEQAQLVYKLENDILVVKQDVPVWKTYHLDYVNVAKKSEGKISLNMSVGGAASGVAGASSQRSVGGNSTKVSVSSDQDFWKEVEEGLKYIVNGNVNTSTKGAANVNSNIVINREAGTVSVKGTSSLHKLVSEYIETLLERAKRQVLIEATVVEVELSDQFQGGIDWSSLKISNAPGGQLPNDAQIQIVSDPNLNNIAGAFNFSVGLKFLQQFGNTKVLSTPKIMAINNQTAILKVVDNQVYFTTTVNTNTNQTTAITTYETQVHTVPVGFMMTLTPFVGENEDITLYIRPTLSRILGYVEDPNPALTQAGAVSRVPIVQEREISSTLRLKNGQIAIIGGLMQDTDQNSRAQLPGIGDIPIAEEAFAYHEKNRKKTELVIFIRPIIVKKPSINGDLSGFRSQLKALEN